MNTNQALMICGCFRERLDAGWWCDGDYYQIAYKPSEEPGTTFEFKGMTFWLHGQNESVVRDFTIEEAKAFMEYLEGNLGFQIGDWTVELTETSRDGLIADLGHAIFYLQRVNL